MLKFNIKIKKLKQNEKTGKHCPQCGTEQEIVGYQSWEDSKTEIPLYNIDLIWENFDNPICYNCHVKNGRDIIEYFERMGDD